MELNKDYFCVFVYKGANSFILLNNIKYSIDFSYSGLTDGSGGMFIGYISLGGNAVYFPGVIYDAKIFNRALTETEANALWNNGLPQIYKLTYSDICANQTSLTSGTLKIGKRYRIDNYVSGDNFTNVGAPSNASGVEFIATGTTPAVWTNGSSLRQVGCVLELKSDNAGAMSWIETMNNLHGITNGNPVCIAKNKDYKSGVSTTTVQLVNSQPANSILKQIIVKNNSASANTVSLGTTTNANEILNAVSISASATKVINIGDSELSFANVERSLYVKAGASNIDVTLIYEKIGG